jgi:hypothetical protein
MIHLKRDMRQNEVQSYLESILGAPNIFGRDKELISPILSRVRDKEIICRERVKRLFSDYAHGTAARRVGEPMEARPLSLAERISAYMSFYAPVLSQDFRRKIGNIVRSEAKVTHQNIAHSPFLLKRIPELDASLIARYSLEREKEQSGDLMSGFDTTTNRHHYVPHTMGGVDFTPNTIDLPIRFHQAIHLVVDNLPPHLGLFLIAGWMKYDNRDYSRHKTIREDIVDLFRDYGRCRDTDLDDFYDPSAIHGLARRSRFRDHRSDYEMAKKRR